MTPLHPPYPGYSWSLSQHMRRASTDMRIMFSLLRGAALFGSAEGYADRITAFVIEQGLVPPKCPWLKATNLERLSAGSS